MVKGTRVKVKKVKGIQYNAKDKKVKDKKIKKIMKKVNVNRENYFN